MTTLPPASTLSALTILLLLATLVVAAADWAAVHRGQRARGRRLEWLFGPLTLVLLIAATASTRIGGPKPWLLAALVLGLLGDVALMFADESPDGASDTPATAVPASPSTASRSGGPDLAFLAGLAAFLVGHAFYLVAFATAGTRPAWLIAGVLVVVAVAGVTLPPVLRGAARTEGVAFAGIVAVYAVLLAAMSVLAVGTGLLLTAIGGVLFLASDSLLARGRFVAPVRYGRLLVIVTYHLAQVLIVIGLARAA